MQPCEELENLICKLYEKEASDQLSEFAVRLYSRQPGVSVIGSDPGDFYRDIEAILQFYQAATSGVQAIRLVEIDAHRKGEVGWVVDRVIATLADGSEVPVRHTYIFQAEADGWKIVHSHISVGIRDEELFRHFKDEQTAHDTNTGG